MKSENTDCRDIFSRALELEGDARDSFLAQACDENTELKLEVIRMLADSEKADAFFRGGDESTLLAANFETPYTEVEGERVGNYILRQQIGEGGFGMVWMAEQREPIKRMVALKVVKAGMDTLVVPQLVESAEYIFRIPEGMDEIRVFAVGSRIRKNTDQWDNINEALTQNYFVARADDRISQDVRASLKDGVLSGLIMSITFANDSRPIRLTEAVRNQIHADIVANQRTMPIYLVEKSDPYGGERQAR